MEKRRINVRGIVYKDGKILAVKHKNKDGSEAPYWAVPGGGLDPLESLQDGLVREFIEETGIRPKVGKLLFIQQFASERTSRDEELEFFFYIENADEYQEIDLIKTTHGTEELARCEFINPKTENILPKFLQTVDIEKEISKSNGVTSYSYLS